MRWVSRPGLWGSPAIVLLLSTVASANITGSLTTPTGVVSGGDWTSFKISWDISQVGSNWFYQYTVSEADGDMLSSPSISHLILEVSSTFTSANWWDPSGIKDAEVGAYHSGNGNPNIPGSILKGAKLNFNDDAMTFAFYSDRAPQWSDFYAKAGPNDPTKASYAYNASFGVAVANKADYSAAAAMDTSGAILHKLLAPDTHSVIVPAPTAPFLVIIGLAVVGSAKRRLA